MKRTVMAAGAAALVAGGVAAATYASSAVADTDSPTPPAPGAVDTAERRRALATTKRLLVARHGLPNGAQPMYGELTARDAEGNVRTFLWQRGQITTVTAASVTVRSADGTTGTWALGPGTVVRSREGAGAVSDLRTGQTVRIFGERTGDTRTARLVAQPPRDLAQIRERLRELRERRDSDVPLLPRN